MLSVIASMALAGALSLGWAVSAQADLAAAKALIDKHSQLPTFEAPGEPFDAKACMADKKMFVIPLTNANPFNAAISQGFVDAADIVGFELRDWETQMDPAGWIQGINTAVAENFDLIDLQGGLPPEFLVPQITEARAAGVKVTATHNYDATTQEIPDVLDSAANTDYVTVGHIIAAWAMVQTGGKVNANDWATKTQPAVQNALLADSSINYVLPVYDSMSQFIVPAIQIANSDAKVVSYNGTPFVLDMMREGDIVEMNVGESLGWVGMAGTDANMRLLCDMDLVTELNTPAFIFTDENVETAGIPATFNDGYGDVHIEGFKTLWGIK